MREAVKRAIASFPYFDSFLDDFSGASWPIFLFHRVLPPGDACYHPEMATSTEQFDSFLRWLSERYRVVAISELVQEKRRKSTRSKPLCALTFDDGWRDNYVHAFPLLQRYQLPATIFLAVRFIGGRRRFWQERLWTCINQLRGRDTNVELAGNLEFSFPWCPRLTADSFVFLRLRKMLLSRPSEEAEQFVARLEELTGTKEEAQEPSFLNWEEVRSMQAAGISFGSHTLHHTLLTRASLDTAWSEIAASREEMEEHLGQPVIAFSYPWGRTSPEITQQVKEAGYKFAVATGNGGFGKGLNPWMLPRITLSGPVLGGSNGGFESSRMRFQLRAAALRTRLGALTWRRRRVASERFRIAFVIDRIWMWRMGGSERQLLNFFGALDPRYFEPALYVLQPTSGLNLEKLPIPIYVVGEREGGSRLRLLHKLASALMRFRPHVVQTIFLDSCFYGVLAARLARVPVVVQSRRGQWYRQASLPYRIALRISDRFTDHWQCNSRAVGSALQDGEGIPAEKIEVLPNSIDPACYLPATPQERLAARKLLGLAPEAAIFLTISNLRPVKGLPTLVEAAAQVCSQLPHVQFVIIGEGPLERELKAQIEQLGVNGKVCLVGQQLDVCPWLAAADIGVITSLSEGSSNALLEYMATGLPAVASDIPANRELIGGVFFHPGDAADLAEKLLLVWRSPDLRDQLRHQNLIRVREHSPQAFARRLQSFYVTLLAE